MASAHGYGGGESAVSAACVDGGMDERAGAEPWLVPGTGGGRRCQAATDRRRGRAWQRVILRRRTLLVKIASGIRVENYRRGICSQAHTLGWQTYSGDAGEACGMVRGVSPPLGLLRCRIA